jgi:TRAP-type C4-dicarboxylate transport system substrate-binding protein
MSNFNKRVIRHIPFLIIIALLLLTVACASTSSSDAEPSKAIELKISHFMSPKHIQHSSVLEPFAEEVKTLTEGRVKATIYSGGALGSPVSQYDMASTGVTDIAFSLQGYTPGKFPLSSVTEVPFMASSAKEGTELLWNLYSKFPEIQDEYKENKVLWIFTNDPDQIFTTKKEIKTMDDLKGLKIRTPSPASNAVVEAWGAIPIFTPMNEAYDAMQKGVVDGMMAPYASIPNFKLYEVTKNITEGSFYITNFAVTMNKESWNSLSSKDKEIIDGLLDKYRKLAGDSFDKAGEMGKKLAKEKGVIINNLSEEEKEKFKSALDNVNKQWVKDMEKKGLPGQKIFEEALRLSEK